MSYLVGALLALGVGAFDAIVGFDRERGFYPIVMIVIASLYILFAAMGGGHALLPESLIAAPFIALAIAGFRRSLWFVVAALVAHGGLDAVHPQLIRNDGAPMWWPMFCLAYDVIAGVWLAVVLATSKPARTA